MTTPATSWDARRNGCDECVAGHACDQHSEYRELAELRAALVHIAETCIADPDVAQFACRAAGGSAFAPEWTTTPPTEPGFYWFCDTGWHSGHADGTRSYGVHLAMLYRYTNEIGDVLRVVQFGADMHDEWSPLSEYFNEKWPVYWLGPLVKPVAPVTPPTP